MKPIVDYKIYGLKDEWKLLAILYDKELIKPLVDSLDYDQVISYDYLNNIEEPYLEENMMLKRSSGVNE